MSDQRTAFLPGVSAVVPVFNSEQSLARIVERIECTLERLGCEFEVILVNDGSRDRSWAVICELARRKAGVRGIQLMRNYGQHNALLCGIRAAKFSVCVTLDDDGQNPPEEIPKLIRTLHEGFDLVFGAPEKQRHGICRTLASRLTKRAMQSVLDAETARHVSAFKAFHTRLRHSFADYSDAFVAIDVLLSWGAARIGSVQVRHEPRRDGESNYTFRRLVTHALNMATSFSALPLQLASVIGVCCVLLGLGVLGYAIGRHVFGGASAAGFLFLAGVMAIFAGAQLVALGIIGEYIARIHFRSMKKPAYVVTEEIVSAPRPSGTIRFGEQRLELTRA